MNEANYQKQLKYGKKYFNSWFGRIGQNLIKRCLGFEMNVFVYDPYVEKQKIETFGGRKVDDFKLTVKDMDIISIHMPF